MKKYVAKAGFVALVVLAPVLFVVFVLVFVGGRFVMEPSTINHYASFCTTSRVVTELDAGANPNSGDRYSGSSPLFVAASAPNTSSPDECVNTVRALLDAGGDIDRREDSFSLLAVASRGGGTPELIDLLVEKGADVCAPIGEHLPERVRVPRAYDEYLWTDDFGTLSEFARAVERPEMAERLEHHEQACA